MFSFVATLIYLAALAIPIYLLIHFHSQAWYWHVLAVMAALAMGLVPMPAWLQASSADLVIGFVFLVLMVWGAGGLLMFRTHHEKHA